MTSVLMSVLEQIKVGGAKRCGHVSGAGNVLVHVYQDHADPEVRAPYTSSAPTHRQRESSQKPQQQSPTEEEKEVLALGLNFAIAPKQIPTLDIIAATECTAARLDDASAKQLRLEVISIISSSKPPRDNLFSRQHKAIRGLRRDKEIVVLSADKGNVTAVMNQSDYTVKMEVLLNDSAYRRLKRDPTTKVEASRRSSMGSPLSPIVASLYMEAFEKWALETSSQKSNLWIRYVDDVFAIWPHGDQALDEFLTHLNSQHPAIQFTMEKEEDQKIAFLDVQIERTGASTTTSVFRMKTHTNQYINYNSHHHNRIKSGVIQYLTNKAEKICHPTRLPREHQHLRAVFQANGYPTRVVDRSLRNIPNPLSLKHRISPPSTYPISKVSVKELSKCAVI